MGFFRKSSSARNPQSGQGECSHSSSSAADRTSGSQESDPNVPVVNLTQGLGEQRLADWRATAGGGTNSNNLSGAAGGSGGSASGANNNVTFAGGTAGGGRGAPTPRPHASSPNNLILLIERGRWAEAARRAASHEHEVRQLVKLRKTTKHRERSGGGGGEERAHTGADGAGSSGSGGGSSAGGSASPGTSGGRSSGRKGSAVQISNVKCKALHHACQKLRSVHTSIYQRPNDGDASVINDNGASGGDGSNGGGSHNRRLVEDDEYIEACKCILALIRIHPEACKERESRHGCLPLHLCVFSMCATPPPPQQPGGSQGAEGARRGNGPLPGGADGRPPVVPPSSQTSPKPALSSPSSLSLQRRTHRKQTSNHSSDFSLGNISQMIQEESEHQRALTEHRERTRSGEEHPPAEGIAARGSLEEQLYRGIDDMERWLSGLEDRYGAEAERASGRGGDNRVGAPLDALEERSRETDSHFTPRVGGESKEGSGDKISGGKADERTGAAGGAEELAALAPGGTGERAAAATGARAAAPPAAAANDGGLHRHGHDATAATAAPALHSATAPTPEEMQRRYLQLNPRRRDDYSVRVLDALLDAWPKSVKTSSEGGRLPLHMACFGKATVRVLEAVLRAYPDAARQRNHDGFLPIHIAAHWGVSHPDVAPLLLRAYPDGAVGRNRWERTPIEEALGMAGENGRAHQLSLVWSLRRHPTYWIHNDIGTMLLPRNVRSAPWRLVDAGDAAGGNGGEEANAAGRRVNGGGGAVDVDEVGSGDEDDEGCVCDCLVEVQMAAPSPAARTSDARPLAESTDLSLLLTRDKHWAAAALRARRHPREAREAMEVKVRGAYTAKVTPLHYACEHRPTVDVVRALAEAHPPALDRRQEPGGQLPLHAACTWGASPGVVRTLLKANPECAGMRDFLSNLPLHCACYAGAATAVVEALLRAYPQGVWPRNHQGSSAADIARRLGHANRKEVLGLLEGTMARLLARAGAGNGGEEGVEVDGKGASNSLEWV
ncbi:hypothetical protein ACHAXT_008954 [Thalassiosira profunda]